MALASVLAGACSDGDSAPVPAADGGGSSSGSSGGVDGGDGGVIAPPGCDLKVDPKDAPACMDDAVGVFVSPSGTDGGSGKKAEPVKTLQQALKLVSSSRPRIYVCGDETQAYVGPVALTGTSGVSIYGGFECAGWGHKGGKSKITVSGGGEVGLDLDKVQNASFQDLVVEGPAEGAPNSIAARVTESSGVSFKRVKLVAGNGQNQAKAGDGTTLKLMATDPPPVAGAPIPNGIDGAGGTAGQTKTCTCEDGSTSKGGGGGSAGGGGGVDGKPDLGGAPPKDGKGGRRTPTIAVPALDTPVQLVVMGTRRQPQSCTGRSAPARGLPALVPLGSRGSPARGVAEEVVRLPRREREAEGGVEVVVVEAARPAPAAAPVLDCW